MIKKFLIFFFFFFFLIEAFAEIKKNIIQKLKNIENLSFNFEQNINDKKETGNCTIKYPKKIFCQYNLKNKKILVSNGKSIVIKTLTSYYIYPIEKTPLDLILDKEFILDKIKNSNQRIVNDNLINFNFFQNENEINIFFDKKTFNLIGWQTLDVFQNLSMTYLNSIIFNKELQSDLFKLPPQN